MLGTIDKITAESELLCRSTLSLGKNIPTLIVEHIYSTNLVSELWRPKKQNENNRSLIVIEVKCSINRDFDFSSYRPALILNVVGCRCVQLLLQTQKRECFDMSDCIQAEVKRAVRQLKWSVWPSQCKHGENRFSTPSKQPGIYAFYTCNPPVCL